MAVTNKLEEIGRGGVCRDSEDGVFVPEVTVAVQKDLHTLLAYMKQRCAYYPMRAAAPQNGGWDQETLAQLRNRADDMHFIPLGTLVAGRYRARLRFAATAEACAQVVSSSFDIGEYPGLKTEGREMEFEFMVDASLPMYLRLQTAKPAILEGLEILPLR